MDQIFGDDCYLSVLGELTKTHRAVQQAAPQVGMLHSAVTLGTL